MDRIDLLPPRLSSTPSAPARTADRDKALKTARDFESVYVADAFKLMFEGVSSDPASGSSSSDNWRELLVDEYAREMVRRGGFGLAEPIADSLMKIQEAAQS